jgi:hypothetical protein
VQADTHTITAINPTHTTCFHLVNTVFQIGTISVSSGVPDSLAGRRVPLVCQGGSPARWAMGKLKRMAGLLPDTIPVRSFNTTRGCHLYKMP